MGYGGCLKIIQAVFSKTLHNRCGKLCGKCGETRWKDGKPSGQAADFPTKGDCGERSDVYLWKTDYVNLPTTPGKWKKYPEIKEKYRNCIYIFCIYKT